MTAQINISFNFIILIFIKFIKIKRQLIENIEKNIRPNIPEEDKE